METSEAEQARRDAELRRNVRATCKVLLERARRLRREIYERHAKGVFLDKVDTMDRAYADALRTSGWFLLEDLRVGKEIK